MGKIINNTIADTNAVYQSLDLVSGGFLSLLGEKIKNTYNGYLKEKIKNLIMDLKNNNISEDKILNFIENANSYDKDIVFSIIQKTTQSESKIKIFLLSKIWLYKIKNEELNYFYLSLLSSLELFNDFDYEIIYKIYQYRNKNVKSLDINIKKFNNQDYLSTIQKLKSIGFIRSNVVEGGDSKNNYVVFPFDLYFELETLIIIFFDKTDKVC